MSHARPTLAAGLVVLYALTISASAFAQEDEEVPTAQPRDVSSDEDRQAENEVEDPFSGFEPREERREGAQKPVETMDEAELRRAGFVFSDRSKDDVGSTGAILALTVGSAVHGIGHLYVGDTRTGLFLLAMEAASIVAIIGSGTYSLLSSNATSGTAVASPLFKAGLAGFIGSWALDVLGTLQSGTLKYALNNGPERGLSAMVGYRLIDVSGTPMRHGFDVGVDFDNDWLIVSAATAQDVLLDLQQYRLRLGSRPLIGASRLSWLGAESNVSYTSFTGEGDFAQLEIDGRLTWSVGLASLSSTLDQLSVGGSAGWGGRWLQLPDEQRKLAFIEPRGRLVFDLHGELGVTERLRARVGYASPDGILFPADGSLLGITYVDLTYRSEGFGDLVLGMSVGDGFMVSAGGRLWLWR